MAASNCRILGATALYLVGAGASAAVPVLLISIGIQLVADLPQAEALVSPAHDTRAAQLVQNSEEIRAALAKPITVQPLPTPTVSVVTDGRGNGNGYAAMARARAHEMLAADRDKPLMKKKEARRTAPVSESRDHSTQADVRPSPTIGFDPGAVY